MNEQIKKEISDKELLDLYHKELKYNLIGSHGVVLRDSCDTLLRAQSRVERARAVEIIKKLVIHPKPEAEGSDISEDIMIYNRALEDAAAHILTSNDQL